MKCSGYNVSPDEVEKLIHRHPSVAEVAVVGVPDAKRGESPKAFVVLLPQHRGNITENEVLSWCKQAMDDYMCPSSIEFVDSLPKSATGKVLRRLLKNRP
jgi:long-chain acyl-CoA synthetase